MEKVWVVRWFNQSEWIEAFTSEKLAMDHAWNVVRSLSVVPTSLPPDLWEARDEVEEDADLSVEEVTIHNGPLPASRYD